MTNRNFSTGVTTLVLLSLIIFAVTWDPQYGTSASETQNQQAEKTTASLQRFSLNEMVDNAGRVFRGTVVGFEPGTVSAGGTELPTVTYQFRVEHSFKGTFPSKDGVEYAEVTMLGSVKREGSGGNLKKMSALPTLPLLSIGSDYLMLLTPESSIGLTAPIGLGQGSFEIYLQDKQEWARNEYKNAGLFDGPVRYEELASQIQGRANR